MIIQRYELIEEHKSGHTFYYLRDNYGELSIYKDIYQFVYLLNQQDARIKELEEENGYIIFADGYDDNGNRVSKQVYTTYKLKCDELTRENQQLKEQNKQLKFDCAMYKSANYLINEYGIEKAREMMFQSEKQLKQSQNEKAIIVLNKVKRYVGEKDTDVIKYIDNQIKELRR